MRQLKGLRGCGPFVAKNTFRIMTGFSNKPVPTNKSYGETGPGARRFLNILNSFPLRWQISAASQDSADSYSSLLLRLVGRSVLRSKLALLTLVSHTAKLVKAFLFSFLQLRKAWHDFKLLLHARIRKAQEGSEKAMLQLLAAELLESPEAFQFFCCESWKALNFLITRKSCYLRNKEGIIWDEEEEQEEEEEGDELAPKRRRLYGKQAAQV